MFKILSICMEQIYVMLMMATVMCAPKSRSLDSFI